MALRRGPEKEPPVRGSTGLQRIGVWGVCLGVGVANQFIVAAIEPNEKGTVVNVKGYWVEQ